MARTAATSERAASASRATPQCGALLVVLLIALALTGCGAQGRSHRSSPPATPPGTMTHRDLAYGSDVHQRLDVYAPSGAAHAPILLMVHGGGWSRGDKAAAGVVDNKVKHYLPAGYVVVSTNYRLSPQVNPLTQAADVATAMKYVQVHAGDWGGDPARVVLMGHSAGAHLVSLITADPSYRTKVEASPWLGTVSLDSAAYDVPAIMSAPHLPLYDPVFGHDTNLQAAASPTLVVEGVSEALMLVCGSDRSNSCPQAQAFATAVRAKGSTATVLPVKLSHGQIDSEVGAPGALTDGVDAFLRSLKLPT